MFHRSSNSKREAQSRATSFLVIPSASRGIRHETFKVMQRDPAQPSHKATARQATVARDDQCVFPFPPLRIAFAWGIGTLRLYEPNQNLARLSLSTRRDL